MKWLFIIIISVLIFGCNTSKRPKQIVSEIKRFPDGSDNKFIDYDEIESYFIDYKYSSDLYNNKSKTELDSIKYGVILGNIPHNISDTGFVGYLEKIGFVKSEIDKSKFKAIDSVFVLMHKNNIVDAACAFIFRDILIFKNQHKIIGVARVCFECSGNTLETSNGGLTEFGDEKNYLYLKELLRNK